MKKNLLLFGLLIVVASCRAQTHTWEKIQFSTDLPITACQHNTKFKCSYLIGNEQESPITFEMRELRDMGEPIVAYVMMYCVGPTDRDVKQKWGLNENWTSAMIAENVPLSDDNNTLSVFYGRYKVNENYTLSVGFIYTYNDEKGESNKKIAQQIAQSIKAL